MPLSQRLNRTQHHTRKITSEGFEREDGLWDIEARMTDQKSYTFQNDWRGEVTPDQFLHDISMRLTLTSSFEIVDVEAAIDSSPFQLCPAVTENFKRLIGLSLTKGFRKQALLRLGGKQGCTHLNELLPVLATTAFQTLYPVLMRRQGKGFGDDAGEAGKRPYLLNSCHIFSDEGELVEKRWPEYFKGSSDNTDENGSS